MQTVSNTTALRLRPEAGPAGIQDRDSAPANKSPETTAFEHAVTRDRNEWGKAKPRLIEYLRHAQKTSGRSGLDLALEFRRLRNGRGKLSFHEYVQYGVYNTLYDNEAKARFLSNDLHWPITKICCDMTWQAATEDKWLCAHILRGHGVSVPETLAVIDKSGRHYPSTRKISSPDDMRSLLRSLGSLRVFGKENRGICSFGAFQIDDFDDTSLYLKSNGPISYSKFFESFIGDTPYILQTAESNHPFFDRYTSSLATVRVSILIHQGRVHIPFCILKLPGSGSIADSFWRPGNLACNIEPSSGRILSVRSKSVFGTTEYETHPETGAAIVDEVLPCWGQLLDLVNTCAPIFSPIKYQSMDVAITPNGPMLIEINTGGGWDLLQLGSGQGFLTDEVISFLRSCGYKKV